MAELLCLEGLAGCYGSFVGAQTSLPSSLMLDHFSDIAELRTRAGTVMDSKHRFYIGATGIIELERAPMGRGV